MPDNMLQNLEEKLGKQPWYVWAGALTGGGIALWYVIQRRAAMAAATQTTPSQIASDSQNIAGLPYGDLSGYLAGMGPVDNFPNTPFPTLDQGSIPVVPSGETPIYDSNGNLIGWQNPAPTNPPGVQPPAPAPTPTPTPNPGPGSIPLGMQVWEGGADTNGQRWWWGPVKNDASQEREFYLPMGTRVWQGAQGRWWYQTPGGQQQQLTGPAAPVATGITTTSGGTFQPAAQGSGGRASFWQGFLNQGRNTVDQHVVAYGLTSE